jgi:predicted ribosome quality control (RQC) complex YloA/Tae2 family protein
MPFDGIVVKCIVEELNSLISGGRVDRIHQPSVDKIVISVYSGRSNYKLLASANPSCPGIYITVEPGRNPASPPMFCMLLRKHLSGGRVIDTVFNDYERIIDIRIDTIDEMGDRTVKKLVVEIMGRHSNIILVDGKGRIIDSIKHVDEGMSSVREVMPARPYIRPPSQGKESPESIDMQAFVNGLKKSGKTVQNYLLSRIQGFSPYICAEICKKAGVDENTAARDLESGDLERVGYELEEIIERIKRSEFKPWASFDRNGKPLDFHCLEPISRINITRYGSMSKAVDVFYRSRDMLNKIGMKRSSIAKKVNSALKRCEKKRGIHQKSIEDSSNSEELKLYGELITANIHAIPPKADKVLLLNYYSKNGDIAEIPLDPNLTPQENAQLYYKKYSLSKRTRAHAEKQLKQTMDEIEYLENVLHHLENCKSMGELEEIEEELFEQGILASGTKDNKKKAASSRPYHYRSSEGFDIYVGRNNRQNDMLTFKLSSPNDTWLHTRNIPGSHVIIKNNGQEIPQKTIEEAAILSALHSKARMSSKVPVDYTKVRYVKKPRDTRPGMVIYDNFKTIIVDPDITYCARLAAKENQ